MLQPRKQIFNEGQRGCDGKRPGTGRGREGSGARPARQPTAQLPVCASVTATGAQRVPTTLTREAGCFQPSVSSSAKGKMPSCSGRSRNPRTQFRLLEQPDHGPVAQQARPIQLCAKYRDICPIHEPDAVCLDYNAKPQTIPHSPVPVPTATLLPATCAGEGGSREKTGKYGQPQS